MGALALSLSGLATCGKKRVKLTYASDGDTNGLIYYLGTDGLKEAFANPFPSRLAGLMSSNIFDSFPTLTDYGFDKLTDRQTLNAAHTDDLANSWICLILPRGRKIKVNRYSIRSREDNDSQHPVEWVLEASNNVIDQTIAGVNAATWASIDSRAGQSWSGINVWKNFSATGFPANALRIRQTGLNSTAANYFIVGEMDFYGTYYY